MAVKVKTWVWIIVSIVVVGVLFVIAMAGAGLYFFSQHISARNVSATTAATEFDSIRSQFTGQKALIELDERGNVFHANTDRPAGTQRVQSLNIMAFDPDDEKVVKMDLPFWLVRLKMGGTRFEVGRGNNIDLANLHLTVEDLERYGPTLILDHKKSDGSRVLIWSQ